MYCISFSLCLNNSDCAEMCSPRDYQSEANQMKGEWEGGRKVSLRKDTAEHETTWQRQQEHGKMPRAVGGPQLTQHFTAAATQTLFG